MSSFFWVNNTWVAGAEPSGKPRGLGNHEVQWRICIPRGTVTRCVVWRECWKHDCIAKYYVVLQTGTKTMKTRNLSETSGSYETLRMRSFEVRKRPKMLFLEARMLMQAWALLRGQKRVLPRGSRSPSSARHVLGLTHFNGLFTRLKSFQHKLTTQKIFVVFKEYTGSDTYLKAHVPRVFY
jgi:hypothetical protein